MRLLILFLLSGEFLGARWAWAKISPEEIDRAIEATWSGSPGRGSPPADPATLARRVYLDLVGSIPSVDALQSFRADTSATRADELVARLLKTQRFSERWASIFRALLVGHGGKKARVQAKALDQWLEDRIQKRIGMDRLAREIVSAEGTPMDNPAVAVLLQFEDSKEDMAGHIASNLLGVRIQCAQCHNHPFEKWTQADFYGLTAFFARTRRVFVPTEAYEGLRSGRIRDASTLMSYMPGGKGPGRPGMAGPRMRMIQDTMDRLRKAWEAAKSDPLAYQGAVSVDEALQSMGMGNPMGSGSMMRKQPPKQLPVLVDGAFGEIEIPTGKEDPDKKEKRGRRFGLNVEKPVAPRFLTGDAPGYPDPGSQRRKLLADWLTAPANPYFARNMVNRIWAKVLGRGLTEPVDNVANPDATTHKELLDRLTAHFVESGYDLRGLLELIMRTRAYRRASGPGKDRAGGEPLFDRACVRALDPEQVFLSIIEASGMDRALNGKPGKTFQEMKQTFLNQFVHQFEVDEPGETDTFQGTINQALFIMNSPAFNRPLAAMPGGTVHSALNIHDDGQCVTFLTHSALGRDPTPEESRALSGYLQEKAVDPAWMRPPEAPPAGRWWQKMSGRFGRAPPGRDPGSDPGRDPGGSGDRGTQGGTPGPGAGASSGIGRRRAVEDLLWTLMASTEFLVNH